MPWLSLINSKVLGIGALIIVLGYGYMRIEYLEADRDRLVLETDKLERSIEVQRVYFDNKVKNEIASITSKLEKKHLMERLELNEEDSISIDSTHVSF